MKYLALSFFLLCICHTNSTAQKFIQMEKVGKLKVKKYYLGDILTFQLEGEGDYWFTEAIEDIHLEKNMVQFANRIVKLEDITAIRSFNRKRWSVPISKNLMLFGVSWGVLSVLATLANNPLTWAAAIVPAVSFGVAVLIRTLFKHRTFKIGKKRRLRLLDLDRKSFFNQGP